MPNAALWLGRLDRANQRIEVRDVENGTYRITSDAYWLPISRLVHPTTKKVAYAFGLTFSTRTRADELIDRCLRACDDGRTWRPQNKTTAGHHRGGGLYNAGDTEPRDMHYEDGPNEAEPHREYAQQEPPTPEPEAALTEPQPTSAIDKDEVRAIAQEVVDTAWTEQEAAILAKVNRPNVVMVQLNKHETRKIEGLTHPILPRIIQAANRRRNIMLIGPAGTGKSYIAAQVAEALGLECVPMSIDPSLMRHDLYGFISPITGEYVGTGFRDAYENGKVFSMDEIDKAQPGVLAGMNNAIAGSGCLFPDRYVNKHENFVLIATANTYGTGPDSLYVGSAHLDAATLNRFVRPTVGICEEIETHVAHTLSADTATVDRWLAEVRRVRANIERHGLKYVVSPRQSFDGVVLLDEGWTWEECREDCLFPGMTAETRRKADER